jgi:hypothetical protein
LIGVDDGRLLGEYLDRLLSQEDQNAPAYKATLDLEPSRRKALVEGRPRVEHPRTSWRRASPCEPA